MSLRTLYQTLLDSDLVRLRVIARQWDIPLTTGRRPDLAAQLADGMARAEAVERVWELLPSESCAALEDLLRQGGAVPWMIFTRRWGRIRNVGPGRLEREELWREPVSPAESLWYWGFLQRASELGSGGSIREMAIIPDDLALYLPLPPPLEIPPPTSTAPPLHELAGDDGLADDLVTFWALLQNETVLLDAEGNYPPHCRQQLLAHLRPPAESRLALLKMLALEQDWLQLSERGLLRPTATPMLAWLQEGRWAQWLALARAWQESAHWNDLAFVPTLHPDPVAGWPYDPLATRHNLLDLLRHCTPGVWYTLAEIVAYAREHAPDFLRVDGDYDTWSPRDALTEAPLRGFDAWESVEGALLAFVLTGPLFWLGLVDLGRAVSYLPPDTLRLNAAGAAFLGLEKPPELSPPSPVRIRRDGTLMVPIGRRYERFQLSRIALPVQDGAAECYRLTPRSLARARQQHIPLERIIEFLEKATGRSLPAALRKAVEHAYRGGERAGLTRVWVLRVQDPDLLDYPALLSVLQERLGPRVALVREADRERVLALLVQEGVLPEVEEP
jgi:hypothetical protein